MSLLERRYTDEHLLFRDQVRRFFEKEVTPYADIWEKEGMVPRSAWKKMGEQGFLCPWLEEEYGGVGADFLYSYILTEELARTHCGGFFFPLHSDIVVPYLHSYGTTEQKQRWLPGCASGDIITAVAMTEPGTGSDLAAMRTTAVRDGDDFIINGQKTFISNGLCCDLVIVAAVTNPHAASPYEGMSLIVVEDGTPGFEKGRRLEKIGLHSQDTAEMAFVDCRVPASNLLGEEGKGFFYLMQKLQQERLVCAMGSQVGAEEALRVTIDYTKTREAFGRPISRFQYISFELAKMAAEIEVGRAFLDTCILDHMEGRLDVKRASIAKYWICEMLNQVVSKCVQFHGGYGYMEEYPIARMFRDARVQTIYAGTSEIMLLIISRQMGL
ncbi:MAG: acyl-CoA dehydrogenase family protein [Pseudomonadota bacterium]|uniref:Acyl-CoA dehydrogenase n=1 Tax=anaerobic digester metagenome TaxID=1263854 RepID=A0A485M4E3_9ZZZZ|nr:acyl-CoA dehydrogenase family protein [Pseudomonadota bacterium]HON38022.1 acyl-CoA dehydrogenase family protein [Deltaproteobacteria bacterium]HPD20756.1 acyl-CoA dehydrogenase family protein [Deltaproteobacteria bacterium]HRS55039.1 acyl-CoA dehydrogenase family protein [Desulfomonilia bacterium]HRV35253.1 acyl-CoA dehydrogenase family protein [Desulfomonilia bacterium]